jgi:oxygen-independent coproporphyrinogen III oxidase
MTDRASFVTEVALQAREKAKSLARLDKVGLRRTQLGYYYIAHYPPLRAMDDTDPTRAANLLATTYSDGFELYFHIPFCQVRCAFCHFFKEVSAFPQLERQEELVELLISELRDTRDRIGPIRARSIQFGGGTPSALDNRLLARLLGEIEKSVVTDPGCEIKFEIYPQKYEEPMISEKLRILKAFGVSDIVIDLESGNPLSLKRVGRGNSSLEAYLQLIDRCRDHGLDSIVTALMIGMPAETMDSLIETLETLTQITEIKIINTFPFIMREPDPISELISKRPEDFHSAESRDEMCVATRDFLKSAGFGEGPISYFRRPGKQAQQQRVKFECVNLLGFGPSAFSYLNGGDWAAQTFNHCTFEGYRSRVVAKEPAMWRAAILSQQERARRKVIFGLANCKTEALLDVEDVYGVSLDSLMGRELNALLHLGLIEIDLVEAGVRYTGEGLARLEEISYFLGSEFVKQRSSNLPSRDDPLKAELLRHHYYIAIDPSDRALFENFASKFSPEFMWRVSNSQPNGAVNKRLPSNAEML